MQDSVTETRHSGVTELKERRQLRIFAGRSSRYLAEEVTSVLGEKLGETTLVDFASGEIYCNYEESVRGADVFIIQTHGDAINQSIIEQLVMIDAAKRASARQVVAVCPYFGYSRQDRKAKGREPISAKLVADMLQAAGADRVVSIDLHSGQIQGFFNQPFDHLTAMPVLIDYIRQYAPADSVIVAASSGRVKVAERFAQRLQADIAFRHKRSLRDTHKGTEVSEIVGDVNGRHCIIIDDIIDTADTICAAGELLYEQGAADVWMMATHAILSEPAIDRLEASVASRVVVTNTLPLPSNKKLAKIQVLSVAHLIASGIKNVFEGGSVSSLFLGENQF